MGQDDFFLKTICDRCKQPLNGVHTMSWFTEEAICIPCSDKEKLIKTILRNSGIANAMEGCGYIPETNLFNETA